MARTQTQPAILRIIQSDMIALIAAAVPLVALAMYIVIAYFGFFPGLRGRDPINADGAPLFLYSFIVALVVGVPLIIWRYRTIQEVFANGVEVEGQVTNLSFFRDRGRVDYTYVFQGQTFSGGNAIMKNSRTQALMLGRPVTLVVHKDNPKRALARDLYV